MSSSTTIVGGTPALMAACLQFDLVAAQDNDERRKELTAAADEGRMQVAVVDDRAVGYSLAAPWFLGASFLALLYVDPRVRGRGIGSRLLENFERTHGPKVFTSTNLSNATMQRLLRLREWTPCGILNGLDEGDPEIFFAKTL